jgi:hypothetical protein
MHFDAVTKQSKWILMLLDMKNIDSARPGNDDIAHSPDIPKENGYRILARMIATRITAGKLDNNPGSKNGAHPKTKT